MPGEGLLRTDAPLAANVVLFAALAMGAGLLMGAWLARAKRFRQHAYCQATIVLLNLAAIGAAMIPSFRANVLPGVPAKLGKAYFALAAAHVALGTAAEVAALYILLAAGTGLLPPKLRISNYKAWMRGVLVLWWVALLLGIATYARWYVPRPRGAGENPQVSRDFVKRRKLLMSMTFAAKAGGTT
jgi:uncharacterized membrane protein YozB (DUF420 family)